MASSLTVDAISNQTRRVKLRAARKNLQRQLAQQILIQRDASLEIRDGEIFIRRVRGAVRQGETEQQRVHTEHVLERLHDRDAPAFADERGLAAESFFQRMKRGQCSASDVLGFYAALVYSQCGSYEETARRLDVDRRTVKAKVDGWLAGSMPQ